MPTKRASGRRLKSTRLVPALLDRSVAVNEPALQEAIRLRLVIPAPHTLKSLNEHRVKAKLPELPADEAKNLFFVPMRYPGASAAEAELNADKRDSEIWGRSDFYQARGKAFIFKGIGIPPHVLSPGFVKRNRTLQIPLKFTPDPRRVEQTFKGGLRRSTVRFVTGWLAKMQDEYVKALQEGDPVALAAKESGVDVLPIPSNVAAFKPLELPGFDSKRGKRVRVSLLKPQGLSVPPSLLDATRLWLYAAPHPYRLQELNDPTDKQREAVLNAFRRPGEPARPPRSLTFTDVSEMARQHAVRTALVLHIMHHRLGISPSFFSKNRGGFDAYGVFSVFDGMGHNVGPGVFFDFDTITKSTQPRYAHDVYAAGYSLDNTFDALSRLARVHVYPADHHAATDRFNELMRIGRQYAAHKLTRK